MKKTMRTILCTVLFAMLAVSCQKDPGEVEPVADIEGTIEISINGLMSEYTQVDGTKASLINNVRVSWEGGETVYVFDGEKYLGSLVASLEGDEDRYALLSTDTDHTVNAPAAGTEKLTLVYSPLFGESDAKSVSNGEITVSLASQNGAKAPFVAYASLDYNNQTSITNAIVPFRFATSVIKVNSTGLDAGTAIDNATLSNVNTVCRLTLSGTAAPIVGGAVVGTITRTGDTYFSASGVNSEGEAVFQIAVPVLETASEARILTVTQGQYSFEDKNFTTKSLNAATSVNTVCQLAFVPDGILPGKFSVGARKHVHFSQGNLQYVKEGARWQFASTQYETVETDKQNVGENYSDAAVQSYFGWGDNTPLRTSDNDYDYRWPSEISPQDESDPWGSKIDDKGTWRTLARDEWKYLFDTRTVNEGKGKDKSYSLDVTYCGVKGLVLYPDDYTGDPISGTVSEIPEGVVFLPAAGRRSGVWVAAVGDFGRYWSSSATNSDNACAVNFSDSRVELSDYSYRSYGFSVRLVTDVRK